MNRVHGLIVGLLLLAGCGGAPVAIQYYVIDPVAAEQIANLEDKSVQLLDLKIPQYLERFQIARREGDNRLEFSDNHQWGENLRKNLYRTMARNLGTMLGTADMGTAISRSLAPPDYLLRISIESFEQDSEGRVQLSARYQISNGKGAVLASRQFSTESDRDSGSRFGAMVADMQTLYGALSRDIAANIQQLDQAG